MNKMPYAPPARPFARLIAGLFFALGAVLATCDQGLAIGSCNPIDNDIELTPVPPLTSRTMRRHLDLAAESKTQVDVVLVGDSIVEAWPAESISSFAPSFANLGMAGDKVFNVLWRLNHGNWSGYKPKYAVLLLGTNDLNWNQDSCSVALGLEKVTDLMQKIWPSAKIIVINILPRNGIFNSPPREPAFRAFDRQRVEVNEILNSKAAKDQKITTLNFDKSLTCVQFADCKRLYVDMVHLNKEGYEVLAGGIKQSISGE